MERVFTAASLETCKVLLFHLCTGAKDSRVESHLVSVQTHDFKHFLDCPEYSSQDETAGVWGQLVDATVAADVDLDILGEVHKKNIDTKLRIVERGNVVGQTLGSSILSPDNLPPVLGEEAGDGRAKAAEGNTATAEPDHQWDRVGRCGDVARWRSWSGMGCFKHIIRYSLSLSGTGRAASSLWCSGAMVRV